MTILVKKLTSHGKIPVYSSDNAAGADLFAAESCVIFPGTRNLIKTDISITIPEGYYGRIAPRSGLAYKNGIDVLAGVIDRDYTGNIGVILFNTSKEDFFVQRGDRIAQIIFEQYGTGKFEEVDQLPETQRKDGGFGHTGK